MAGPGPLGLRALETRFPNLPARCRALAGLVGVGEVSVGFHPSLGQTSDGSHRGPWL